MTEDDSDVIAQGGHGGGWRIITLVVMALLGVAVVAALMVTLNSAGQRRDEALRLQTHSFEVMILARSLSATIAQSEASLGRYVISADPALGNLFGEQWQIAGQQIDRLDAVSGDNPPQQRLLHALRRAYATRGTELSLIAFSTHYKKNDQALARYYQARKSPALAQMDNLLEAIIARERTLLDARSNDAMRSVARSNTIAVVLGVFGILIVLAAITLGWLTVEAMSERAFADTETEMERLRAEELEQAVALASAELLDREARLRQVQKMQAVGQLTGGIAHDFNNMLAVVLGGLELARRNVADTDQAVRHIDNATEGANRAAALTRRLLAFSREEALKVDTIDPGALVADMSDLLDRTLGDAIIVTTQDAANGWTIAADRYQLENVILNLAVNARDAMEARGRLSIATGATSLAAEDIGTCAAGDYVTIEVTDNGCGMTPDIMERVFEPFFTTKPVGQGTGLGLSQIFAFVRQAEGEIRIESTPGEGTSVTLYLPRQIGVETRVADAIVQVAPAKTDPLDILVVEDDSRVLAATIGALTELGHRPIACNDPLASPAMLEQAANIDLIVSDVLMAGLTGPEMIAALAPRYGHIAVLYVTGYAGEAGGEVEFGGHNVLRKPFTISALERAIHAAMNAPRAADTMAAE